MILSIDEITFSFRMLYFASKDKIKKWEMNVKKSVENEIQKFRMPAFHEDDENVF